MAWMQQIKTAVREHDAAAVAFLAAKPQNRFLKCQDCRIQRISMRAGKRKNTLPEKLVYHVREVRRPRAVDSVVTHFEELSHYRKLGSVLIWFPSLAFSVQCGINRGVTLIAL